MAARSMEHTFMMTLDYVGAPGGHRVRAAWSVSSLLRAPLRRHWNRDEGRSPVWAPGLL